MNEEVIRHSPQYLQGLSSAQVQKRMESGLNNKDISVKTKTEKEIILSNVLNFFNILNTCFALLIIIVGVGQGVNFVDIFKNLLFMGVIFSNTAIAIFQEIRSKRVVDKLNIISELRAEVVRNSTKQSIPISQIVLDDIICFSAGKQINTDSIILNGEVEVDESLVTGESETVIKKLGDMLLSGSFVTSGECYAKAEHIGLDNYANTIVKNAKYIKKPNSDILKSLNILVKTIGFTLIPLGIILFCKQYFILSDSLENAVFTTVAAMIAMIPEGLVLLTSMVFAISVIRLSQHKTLVQELYCIETLARVDMLCLDKTGTITEGSMQVDEIVAIEIDEDEMKTALASLAKSLQENATMSAIAEKFSAEKTWTSTAKLAFSSKRKCSGASFENADTYILGASEFVLKGDFTKLKKLENEYSQKGQRVLVLAKTNEKIVDKTLPNNLKAVGLVVLSDKIRQDATKTLDFFKKQGVKIKLISGDNPVTVSAIAKKVGLENADNYIDMSCVADEKIDETALRYTVFGRVSPEQKLKLVKALKRNGHTVAMTGDGVNDVLALKEADCSIAMASGSDAARSVSNLVLLNSNFSAMPLVVEEGRKSINNLERSASLFLTKTTYSVLLSVLFIFAVFSYPFEPIHVTLIGSLAIGIPSFILALEPNKQLVKGKFLTNVIKKAVPSGVGIFVGIFILVISSAVIGFSSAEVSTMAVIITITLAFRHLALISKPFNLLRGILLALAILAFLVSFFVFPNLFDFAMLTPLSLLCICIIIGIVLLAMFVYERLSPCNFLKPM